ncbi:hypothetical protein D3C72_1912370 [compost metagenome]
MEELQNQPTDRRNRKDHYQGIADERPSTAEDKGYDTRDNKKEPEDVKTIVRSDAHLPRRRQ